MGQHDDRGLVVRCDLGDRFVRPLGDQLIGRGDPLGREERRAGVGDDCRPAEQLRSARERLRRVDRPIDEEAWRRAVPLGEHLGAVGLDEPAAPAADQLVELGERLLGDAVAECLGTLDDEGLGADTVALDDGEEHGAPALLTKLRESPDETHSTASTKTSISPPQGRPTLQAKSSVMP